MWRRVLTELEKVKPNKLKAYKSPRPLTYPHPGKS